MTCESDQDAPIAMSATMQMPASGPSTRLERFTAVRSAHPVLGFIVRRIAWAVVTLWAVSVLVFIATAVLPGNAANAILGRSSNPQAVAALEQQLHLNHSLLNRYWYWLSNFVQGNFGKSAAGVLGGHAHASVSSLISTPLGNSAVLAAITVAIFIPLSVLIGVFAATRAGRPIDQAISLSTLTATSLPEFVTGSILVAIFAIAFGVLPAVSLIGQGQGPLSSPEILILPVATLLAATLAQSVRMVRANTLETLRSDYVAAARLGGVSERRVLARYALRNALAPSVQVIALNMQWLLGGIVITEAIFSYPGIGQVFVSAVNLRDIPTVQSVTLLLATFYIALNIVADLIVTFLVPKLRTAR